MPQKTVTYHTKRGPIKKAVTYESLKGSKHIPRSGRALTVENFEDYPSRHGNSYQAPAFVRSGSQRAVNNKYGTNQLTYFLRKGKKGGIRKVGKHFDTAVLKAVRALKEERALMLGRGKVYTKSGKKIKTERKGSWAKGETPDHLKQYSQKGAFSAQAAYARYLNTANWIRDGKKKGKSRDPKYKTSKARLLADQDFVNLKGKFVPSGFKATSKQSIINAANGGNAPAPAYVPVQNEGQALDYYAEEEEEERRRDADNNIEFTEAVSNVPVSQALHPALIRAAEQIEQGRSPEELGITVTGSLLPSDLNHNVYEESRQRSREAGEIERARLAEEIAARERFLNDPKLAKLVAYQKKLISKWGYPREPSGGGGAYIITNWKKKVGYPPVRPTFHSESTVERTNFAITNNAEFLKDEKLWKQWEVMQRIRRQLKVAGWNKGSH